MLQGNFIDNKVERGVQMGVFTSALAGYATFRVIMKQFDSKDKKMSIGSELRIEQNIKGRLRAYCDRLKDKSVGDSLKIQLARIDGINKVTINSLTGSILIIYDSKKIDNNLLVPALMKLLGIDLEADEEQKSIIMNEMQLVNKSVNNALLNSTKGVIDLDTLIPIGFLGLAIKEIINTGTLGTPAPLTLLNWSYLGLTRRR